MIEHKIDFFMMTEVFKKSRPVILWLDDERDPNNTYPSTLGYEPGEYRPTWVERIVGKCNPGNWDVVWVKNYTQFIDYLKLKGIPDVVCFDHDLGEQVTGKDCANYMVDLLVERNEFGPVIRCQSSNPSGVANIMGLFSNWHREWLKRNPDKINKINCL